MSSWAIETYGDPCSECGFDWGVSIDGAVSGVLQTPDRYADLLDGLDGSQRHPDLEWSAVEYVCHVVDNLRIWAERLEGAPDEQPLPISPYDVDALARARAYAGVPLAGAIWSLRRSVSDWSTAVGSARARRVTLIHPDRGLQSVEDVAVSNSHDASHHGWDIRRILAAAG